MSGSPLRSRTVAWCDAVCRSLRQGTRRLPGLWVADDPPPGYPDVATLTARATAAQVVEQLDRSSASWVKDSFAVLDLAEHGFAVATEARWTYRAPRPALGRGRHRVVGSDAELARWTAASGTAGAISGRLLDDPAVRLVAVQDGRLSGGAALSASGDVVGISNVFPAGVEATWDALVSAAAELFPDRALVGYETGDALDAAVHAGFVPTGSLRIWRRPALGRLPGPASSDHGTGSRLVQAAGVQPDADGLPVDSPVLGHPPGQVAAAAGDAPAQDDHEGTVRLGWPPSAQRQRGGPGGGAAAVLDRAGRGPARPRPVPDHRGGGGNGRSAARSPVRC